VHGLFHFQFTLLYHDIGIITDVRMCTYTGNRCYQLLVTVTINFHKPVKFKFSVPNSFFFLWYQKRIQFFLLLPKAELTETVCQDYCISLPHHIRLLKVGRDLARSFSQSLPHTHTHGSGFTQASARSLSQHMSFIVPLPPTRTAL
jgi:hypothetical protein